MSATDKVDYLSKSWQQGYWVGRGELRREDVTAPKDASFVEGDIMGSFEAEVNFHDDPEGTHGTYTPTLHSLHDLENGLVVRMDDEDDEPETPRPVPVTRTKRKAAPKAAAAPVAKHTLHDWQAEDVLRMLAEPTRAVLIGHDMGKGKTTLACEFIIQGGFTRTLTVGVKDTFGQFNERIEAQSDGTHKMLRLDATKPGEANFKAFIAGEPGHYFAGSQFLTTRDWASVPKTNLQGETLTRIDATKAGLTGTATFVVSAAGEVRATKALTEPKHLGIFKKMKPVDALIVDEVHVFANRKAVGRKTLLTIKNGFKVAMSGTWYGNKVENMWSITRWLWPELIEGNFFSWRNTWCEVETVYLRGGETTSKTTGEVTPGAFVASLPLYIRSEADEQPPAAQVAYVDLTPAQRAQYDELEADLLTWLDSREGPAPLVIDFPIALRTRLRTAALGEMSFDDNGEINFALDCKSSKLAILKPILDKWGDQPVIIGTDSKRFAKVTVARMRALGYNAVEWSGDVSSKKRDEIKAAFLAGTIQYIVAVIPSMSTGLDGFQTVCSKLVILSETENQIVGAQFIARLFRPGRTLKYGAFEMVTVQARDTYDEGVFTSLGLQRFSMNNTLRLAA